MLHGCTSPKHPEQTDPRGQGDVPGLGEGVRRECLGSRVSVWEDENVWRWIGAMVTQHCEWYLMPLTYIPQMFQRVNFMLGIFYQNIFIFIFHFPTHSCKITMSKQMKCCYICIILSNSSVKSCDDQSLLMALSQAQNPNYDQSADPQPQTGFWVGLSEQWYKCAHHGLFILQSKRIRVFCNLKGKISNFYKNAQSKMSKKRGDSWATYIMY